MQITKKSDSLTEATELNKIRADFPILKEKVHGKDLVYFDNAATAQKPQSVIDAITEYYLRYNSNVHRGVHSLSQKATELYEAARDKVRDYIHASSSMEIVFTKGTTESMNLLAHSLSHLIEEGDEILTTEMEHHSNFVPWQAMAKTRKAKFIVCPVSDDGELDISQLGKMMSERTKILAICHASNTLGSINDIKKISELAHEKGILVAVDGAQYIPHGKIDVQEMGCDYYAFSGHKLIGPTGIGVLYGKMDKLKLLLPYQYGGGMISEVGKEETTYGEIPQVFEAGTPNIAGAHGLAAAIDYMNEVGFDFIHEHEQELLDHAMEGLKDIPGIEFYGRSDKKVSLVSFLIKDIHPFDLGTLLDQMGIAVRTGHHCTQPLMTKYGIPGTVRASFAFYNTKEEIDRMIEGINKAVSILK